MLQFWLGIAAGLAIGLALEWLVDWSSWTQRRAHVRPNNVEQVLSQKPGTNPASAAHAPAGDIPRDVEPIRIDDNDEAART